VGADAVELLDSIIEMGGPNADEDIRRLEEFERTGIAVPGAEVNAWIDPEARRTSFHSRSHAK
jgi:inosine-uridine nucleoside N-ribohydrolase